MSCDVKLQKKAIAYILAKRPSDVKTVLSRAQFILGADYTIPKILNEFTGDSLKVIRNILESVGFDFSKKSKDRVVNVKHVSNIDTIFTSPIISDLFDTMHIAEGYFQRRVNQLVIGAVILNKEGADKYVSTNEELNMNIKFLKNDLFEEIVRYLDKIGKLEDRESYFMKDSEGNDVFRKPLYNPRGSFINYKAYKQVLKSLETALMGDNPLTLASGKKIPNLKGNINKIADRQKFDAYNAAVILSNFDNILSKFFGNIITLNYSVYNDFKDPVGTLKYTLDPKGKMEEYWKNEEHMSESVEEIADQLSKNIIESIPHYNKKGEVTGLYLDTKDLYSLGSLLKEFETINFKSLSDIHESSIKDRDYKLEEKLAYTETGYENWKLLSESPMEMLEWYLNMIIDINDTGTYDTEGIKEKLFTTFRHKIDIVKSLKNFIELNKNKEKNSAFSVLNIITQVINNSYGANYSIYNKNYNTLVSQEMHSHNANRVDVQNSLYSFLLSNSENPNKFWVGIEPNGDLKSELESIKLSIETDLGLSNFIKNKFGIYIGEHGAADLRNKWKLEDEAKNKSKNEDKDRSFIENRLQDVLKLVRSPLEKDKFTLLEEIQTNEKNIADRNLEQVKSNSEVISILTQSKTIQDIIDIYLDNFILRPIMNISTLSGEKIPTYKLANLMYDDTNVLRSRQKIEQQGGRNYKNLFLSTGGLLGTSTKLEAINKNENKSAFKWTPLENFTANFEFDFLDVFKPKSETKGINVMIGNYSDKNSILSKIIDKNIQYFTSKDKQGKYIIGNKEGKDIMTITELLELSRTQMMNYYTDLFNNIFEQYEKLGVKIKPGKFDENVKSINNYLQLFESKDDFLIEVNKRFQSDKTIQITEELHYSSYNNTPDTKILSLNQLLVDYYRIFNDKSLFNNLVDLTEQSLINKLEQEKGEFLFTESELSILNKDKHRISPNVTVLDSLLTSFGITNIESFTKKDGITIKDSSGKINPLLKRWLWVNNLFKNEYLNITVKSEYMHPHKVFGTQIVDVKGKQEKQLKLPFRGDSNKINWNDFQLEMSARLPNMSKRNVSFTATYEIPNRNYRLGTPENVNVAVIGDHSSKLYNISGKTTNQDAHDGSSIILYAYSKMIENSYPGKSYKGTKKQIGTFVTEFGSALKKDAETVLTNDKIRNSKNSEIRLKDKQKQALSAKQLPSDVSISKKKLPTEVIYYKNGEYYKIKGYDLANGFLSLKLEIRNVDGTFTSVQGTPIKVNTLYDIWEAFGAEYSVNEDLKFTEGSNDLLYDLITSYEKDGNYELKENFIHIISNHTSFKSGATNINPSSYWTDSTIPSLSYVTYENRFMGPQLDANHTANESKIKEITQIISALAQNPTTAYLAEEVYDDIAKIIETSAEPYLKQTSANLDPKLKQKFYRELSKNFAHSLATSDGVSLAKTIAETFQTGQLLPFSNQNFFREFTKDMVTKMNNEFITRYYPGIGAVLNPSHGIIQVYEDKNGRIYTQQDVIENAFKWYNSLSNKQDLYLTNNEIISTYINNTFDYKDVIINEINPGDVVLYNNIQYNLSDIETYYDFKLNKPENTLVRKLYNVPRDLKPSEIIYTINGISKNIFDSDSVKLKYVLNRIQDNIKLEKEKKPLKPINPQDLQDLSSFAKNFNIDVNDTNKLDKYLNAWTQRNLQLLDKGFVMMPIRSNKFINKDGSVNFKLYFDNDTLINKMLSDVENHYITNNSIVLDKVDFKPAELILPNIYKSAFDTGNDSVSSIQSSDYFKQKLIKEYEDDDTEADFKINLKDGNNPVYVIYVNDLPNKKTDQNLFTVSYNEGSLVKSRVSQSGQKLYVPPKLGEDSLIVSEDGVDKLYIKVGNVVRVSKDGKSIDRTILKSDLNDELKKFIKSFDGEISSIIPLMNNPNSKLINESLGEDLVTLNNLNNITFNIFRRYSNFKTIGKQELNNQWYNNNRELIINSLGNKMFASWEKSKEFVAARIPAQSMQSFMEMKNIAYFNTDSNDAYVSLWQIWLQGSDFDIDKAYIMGYGFNKNAQYDIWNSLFDYSTKEELDAIEKLPLPSGEKSNVVVSNIVENYDREITKFGEYISTFNIDINKPVEELTFNFPAQIIGLFETTLRRLRKDSNLYVSTNLSKTRSIDIELFQKIIDKYNLDKGYVHKKNSIRNSIVSKIKRVISTPSNYILASEPISIKALHDAARKSKEKLGFKEDLLSSWDLFSVYQQQQNAAVGKDDVGIGANGLKVFFALSNYYNSWFSDLASGKRSLSEINQYNPKSINKVFTINGKTRHITTIANVGVNDAIFAKILDSYGYQELDKELTKLSEEQAALHASGFVSGATDNAKELVMAKINAVVELSSMHLYLITLGYSMDDIAMYMNSDLGRYIAKNITGNIFKSTDSIFINNLIEKYKTDNSNKPGINEEVKQFQDIYSGSQELKVLAQILKVNQKTSANLDELNKFLSTLESAIYIREHEILGKSLIDLRVKDKWELVGKINGVNNTTLIDHIVNNNPLLKQDIKSSRNHVKSILRLANNLEVSYINEKGVTEKKKVSLIGGQFDFRYYLHPDNHAYRDATIKYYNLFKNTINIFDVIENSPHFKAMINGVSIIHNVLSLSSKKYNFVFSKSRDIIHRNLDILIKKNKNVVKNKFGNEAFMPKITDVVLNRLIVTYDKFAVASWLKSQGNIDNFRFSAKKLLELSGKTSITLYKDDSLKFHSIGDIKSQSLPSKIKESLVKITKDSDDFVIDLKTDHGIANFKMIMEDLILPILQSSKVAELGNSLKLSSVKNPFGIFTNQITSTFGISNLNSPINMEKYQKLLSDFNEIDVKIEPDKKIKNSENKVINYQDLFYVYNLVINNEMYGDKRLTPLFEDYIKRENTIGNDYLNYSIKIDLGEIDIFDLNIDPISDEEINLLNKLQREQDQNILFLGFHHNGKLLLEKFGGEVLTLKNGNYPINTSMEVTSNKDSKKYIIASSIMSILKNRNIIINFNCD